MLAAIMLLSCIAGNAQTQREIKREGNTFSVVSTKSTSKDEGTKTKFTWKDSKGVEYPVMKSKNNAYYVVRTSKKTGKEYKQYLPKEVQAEMKKADK